LLLLAAASALPLQQDVSSSARRLASPAKAAGQTPKPAPKLISIEDLLAGLDLSGGPKSVEVQLTPPDSQRPAVVVSSMLQLPLTVLWLFSMPGST
jgi:hypothetical protein